MTTYKLLHIITNLELGGAQKHALYVIKNMGANYKKHFISSTQGLLYEDCASLKGINVTFLRTLKRNISPTNDVKALIFLIRYMRSHKIDIVHTHSSKAGILGRWAAKIAGVPVIIHTIHGWSFNDYINSFLKWLYVFLERVTAAITTRFIAVSKSDINKGLFYKIGRKEQYTLIRYGIQSTEWMQATRDNILAERLGISSKDIVVGMVACLKPQKNPLDFVRLAEILIKQGYDNLKFISVGDGIIRMRMEELIKKQGLGKQVKLLGWRRDVSKIMPLFDIVVLTSLWEGAPIVLIEAMAQAKPIVAYDVDGIKEIVRDTENGYLVKAMAIEDFAEKIKTFLDDRNLIVSMGKASRELLTKTSSFQAKTMIANIEELYLELAENIIKKKQ